MDKDNENTLAVRLSFAAIDSVVRTNVVKPTEVRSPSRDWISWGKDNAYPDYLRSLRQEAATLKSVIDGIGDYVTGNRIEGRYPFEGRWVNRKRQTWRDLFRSLDRDWSTYGALAFEVIRNAEGDIVELYWTDVRYIRTNEDRSVFWYSEDWKKRWNKKKDIVIPAFQPDARAVASSLIYVVNTEEQVYGECPFGGAVIAAELERDIDQYHLNSMHNGFTGSTLVNFNNGVPSDEVKREIEKNWDRKFSGFQNAGRSVFSYNDDREHQATIQELKASDFSDKYEALSKRSRQQIFTAYRANPNLFGIPTESLGFSSEEYESAFKLFNRTTVQPHQQTILDAIALVGDYGITIEPFSLQGDEEAAKTATTTGQEAGKK